MVPKIVGGERAYASSWPSMALLEFNYKADFYLAREHKTVTITSSTFCGAVLIDRQTLLTAAHCMSH